MNQKLKTALAFTKNVFVTGALFETSKKVEKEICKHINKEKDIIVVEYGMGHGNITREILNNISPNSKLYSFEVNKDFCEHVKKTIQDDRLTIINDSAQNVRKYFGMDKVDNVIASIPFSLYSEDKKHSIIVYAHDILDHEGFYSQVSYTQSNFKKFERVFQECELIKLGGFPTEYIYHSQKVYMTF